MKFVDQCENHYPVLVMQRDFEAVDDLNAQLFDEIAALARQFKDTDQNAVRGGRISTQGGYQTSDQGNLFTMDLPGVRRLHQELLKPAVDEYLVAAFEDQAAALDPWLVGWANLLNPGDWQAPHNHPTAGNLVSAVYYVRLPGDRPNPEGRIEFINPIPESVHHGYAPSRRIHPQAGKLVLFPPYYMHYVHPFRGDLSRAIIAFDVLAKKPGLNLVF